jgi:hypothetical protein
VGGTGDGVTIYLVVVGRIGGSTVKVGLVFLSHAISKKPRKNKKITRKGIKILVAITITPDIQDISVKLHR